MEVQRGWARSVLLPVTDWEEHVRDERIEEFSPRS
jgi:hypothetical protein